LGRTFSFRRNGKRKVKIKKRLHYEVVFLCNFYHYSSGSGAPTGQTPAQVPHPIQASLLITYLLSPCEIQDTGQLALHAPHPIHLSVILYAIFFSPPLATFFITFVSISLC
jgi:hypothetical protein